MSKIINTLIFSKDRAAQLDLFLRSMKRFYSDWTLSKDIHVLYTYSTEAFKEGYAITIKNHPDISFVLERNFKQDIIELISPKITLTQFFVDDNIFKDNFSLDSEEMKLFQKSSDIVCLSLRLCQRINYCYPMNVFMKIPEFVNERYMWKWDDIRLSGCWAYPMSLDGNIFKTSDLYPLLVSLEYHNPNLLEGMLVLNTLRQPYMMCFKEAKVLNIPANKVQNLNDNRHGKITALSINNEYIKGKKLSLTQLFTIENFKNNTACHEEIPLKWG